MTERSDHGQAHRKTPGQRDPRADQQVCILATLDTKGHEAGVEVS